MPRLGSQSSSSYNPEIDAAQNVLIQELQQNAAAIRVGTGVPTDTAFTDAGGTLPSSTAQSPIWIDRSTGNTYWRDGATNTWLALGTGASVPTYSYPLLVGSGDYANFESLTTTTDPVPIARVFEQQTGTNGMPVYAGSDLEDALSTPGRSVMYSCKPTITTFGSGAMDTQFNTFLDALIADLGAVSQTRRVYIAVHHEPIPDYRPSEVIAAIEKLCDLVIAKNRADLIPCMIFRGNGDWETSGLNNTIRNTLPDGILWGATTTASGSGTNSTTLNVASGSVFPSSGSFTVRIDGTQTRTATRSGNTLTLSSGATWANGDDVEADMRWYIEDGSPSTLRAWDWLPDVSYAPNIVIAFDVYSYYPSYTSNASSSNDRSLRHLMRLILPMLRARGFTRWGIAENAMQKPQADPQFGGGTNSATRSTTDWSNTDRLQRLVGLNPPTDTTYNFQSNTVNHPAYLPWLTALAGPFPASGTVTDPYDTSQFGTGTGQSGASPTSPTQFKNPGQAYDPGSNGCEFYTWFNSDVGSQGDYSGLNTAIADALQAASS